ncbi:uncharacterized protein LOC142974201 [Anticarsia gemmatalis]|uniref:uncharacterized protein LOC142974201 n=1 Tax=Anticarsia gemmatalis TaxID=129554 RepID=UPI003F75DB81
MPDEFANCIKRVNFFMKLIGLHLDIEDDNRTMFERLRHHRLYIFHLVSSDLQALAEAFWLIDAFATGKSFLEITSLFPCVTLRLLCNFRTVTTLYYAHRVNEVIEILGRLQLDLSSSDQDRDSFIKKLLAEKLSILNGILNKTLFLVINGVLLFAVQASALMISHYYSTGEFQLILPFIAFYPFDISYQVRSSWLRKRQ